MVEFIAQIVEAANGADEIASLGEFNAAVVEGTIGLDTVIAAAIFLAQVNESVDAADEFITRLLWEIINNAQPANWSTVPTAP